MSQTHSAGRPKFHVTFHPPKQAASPQPPKTGRNGEANGRAESVAKPEVVQQQPVVSTDQNEDDGLLHHLGPSTGEADIVGAQTAVDESPEDASSSGETDWDEVAAFVAEAVAADPTLARYHQVVKQDQVPNSKRNQPLTLTEEDRFLLCLSLGQSMRQAAATIGVHHTTLVKRAKRDDKFARAIALAKQRARNDPLLAVRQASQKSWRAAAWLLNYLDRRDNRGSKKRPA